MPKSSVPDIERDLRQIVGERVTVSPQETWYYGRDLLKMPGWAERLVRSTPDAVVAPQSPEEVSAVLKYCSERGIPVTPRGAGSSGLFGAVPKKAGIVLDLRGMESPLSVNAESLSVTSSAAMTWWELDRKLAASGLALKSYPSSARSASLAGWIMTTGLGIGNIKYGPVHDQVSSARIVLADGSIREFGKAGGLDVFMGSEGLLGVMTEVILDVRPLPAASSHRLVHFPSMPQMFEFLTALLQSPIVPYSVEFFDDGYLEMLRAGGYKTTSFSKGEGIALVTYDGSAAEVASGVEPLNATLRQFSGELRDGGEEEWRQRFNMLRVKRAAPSLIPGSVHVPFESLVRFYTRLARLKKRPIGVIGHVTSKDGCVLMPMTASDQRRSLEYTLALHTPAEIANLAVSLGGYPGGGLGLWNAAYRDVTQLKQKTESVLSRKKEIDPKGILNPGMWSEAPFLFKPSVFRVAVSLGHAADSVLPGKLPQSRTRTPEEFTDCVQCGYCMGYCPTRQQWLSSTPRGRILSARERLLPGLKSQVSLDKEAVNDIFECTLCGRCRVDCSVDIKSPEMWTELRCGLSGAGYGPESLSVLSKTILDTHNLAAKPNEQRGRWADSLKLEHRKEQAETVYFVGCVTSFYPMVQDVARSFAQILNKAGTDFAILGGGEWCCGYPLLSAGRGDEAVSHIEANIEKVKAIGARRIVATCTGCYRMWKQDYPRITGKAIPFEVLHSTQVIGDLIKGGGLKLGELKTTVTYHDPCDLGRNAGVYEEPRSIITSIPGLKLKELESNRQYCNCCGSGGDLLASNQTLSLDIAARKVKEIMDTGAEAVVTACPSCIRAISMARLAQKAPFVVQDISQIVWKSVVK